VTVSHRFAYAQARLQARFARLPQEQEWQRLVAARTLAAFLEEARLGTLREWIKGFSGQSDAHDLEAGVRVLFRETVAEVAAWVPASWRESVLWTRWLALIPLLEHLARGGTPPPWIDREPLVQALGGDGGTPGAERRQVTRAGALFQDTRDPAAAWKTEWLRLRPPANRVLLRNLDALGDLLDAHVRAFRAAAPETTWEQRKVLRRRLALLLHRRQLQPVAPFAFLALVALDLERLRGELVTRALFGAGGVPV
jgi:hypothetical protein